MIDDDGMYVMKWDTSSDNGEFMMKMDLCDNGGILVMIRTKAYTLFSLSGQPILASNFEFEIMSWMLVYIYSHSLDPFSPPLEHR